MRSFKVTIISMLLLIAGLLCGGISQSHGADASPGDFFPGKVRLLLPPVIYATPGIECNVYYDNVLLTLSSANYAVDVTCPKGLQFQERWTYTPVPTEAGDYPIILEVRDESNAAVARAQSIVRVSKETPEAKPATILIVGDSLTEASVYPQHILELSKRAGKERLRFIGSRGAGNMPPIGSLRHEGYSGWTAEAFTTLTGPLSRSGYYQPGATGSPFIYELEDGSKSFDFARYCTEFNGGKAPNLITIGLGTNDVFTATDQNIDQRIDVVLKHYDIMIESMHKTGPKTKLGVQLPTPASVSQDGFRNYIGAGKQTRWQYRRDQHRLIERFVQHYGDRAKNNIFVVPVYLNLDSVHGFPTWSPPINSRTEEKMTRVNNGTHPNEAGYQQIGDAVYAWIANMLGSID